MSDNVIRLSDRRKPDEEPPGALSIEVCVYEDGVNTLWAATGALQAREHYDWAIVHLNRAIAALIEEKDKCCGMEPD